MSLATSSIQVAHVAAGRLFGGVESILVNLARRRDLAPMMVPRFFICYEGRLRRELEEAGAPVHTLGEVRVRRPWSIVKARRALAAGLRSQRCSVMVCHSTWEQALLGRCARLAGIPSVFWLHSRTTGSSWLDRLARRNPPQAIVSVSKDTDATATLLFPGVPSRVIYTPLALNEAAFAIADRAAVRREMAVHPATLVIIQVSRMEAWKGQEIHLKALAELPPDLDWVCWIVGGVERPSEQTFLNGLQAQAKALGIAGRVRFLGKRTDVPSLLKAADIYCQPNLGPEGFSIAFLEAYVAELPLITSAIGGAGEIVTEDSGYLLPPGDVAPVVAALRALAGNPAKRQAMGLAGRRRVDELCDPGRQMHAIARYLLEVAACGERHCT